MARGAAKQRAARPKPSDAGRRHRGARRQSVAEQTMFFPRLRKQVKWMFVFLALVFAGGFVIFNVGSGGGGTGIGDLLINNNGSSSGSPSASAARKRIAKNPRDAAAYLDLATALQTDGKNDEAIAALERYSNLRPKDGDGLNRLATAYVSKATSFQQQAQAIQQDAQSQLPGQIVSPGLQIPGQNGQAGRPLIQPPIDQSLFTSYSTRLQVALREAQDALTKAVSAYRRSIAITPDDANLQLQLADAAQLSGDTKTAIGAYRRFLKLAPEDSNARFVKAQIKRLEQTLKTSTITPKR